MSDFAADISGASGASGAFDSADVLAPLEPELRRAAFDAGLDDLALVAVDADSDAATFEIFAERVRRGQCADLDYLTADVGARRNLRSVLPSVRTVLVGVLSERRLREESRAETETLRAELNALEDRTERTSREARTDRPAPTGAILGYAALPDYHSALRRKLKRLQTFVRERFPNAETRIAVDTAPILEKDWAARAGLGFCGLHSLLISRRFGSRLFLGELLVSIPRGERADAERRTVDAGRPDFRFCLSCGRCVAACPTGALVGDRTVDARRCLNYWTLETRRELPPEIARKLGGRLLGCDVCRRVCPLDRPDDATPPVVVPLETIERLDDAEFRRLFKKTPTFRARLEGLRRTAETIRRGGANDGD